MIIDPIVDELHQQRAEEMERFNFDFEAFFRHLKEQEKLSGKPLVSPPESALTRLSRCQPNRAGGRRRPDR